MDFGPLSIAQITEYCNSIENVMNNNNNKKCIYHITSTSSDNMINTALLLCSYLIIVEKYSAVKAYKPFKNYSFIPYRDALNSPST